MIMENEDFKKNYKESQQPEPEQETPVNPLADLPRPELPRLIVFGGSFDPIHRGHVELAQQVLKLGYGQEVMFIPALCPPHKMDKQCATPQQRLDMLKLVVEDNQAFSYSDIELQRTDRPSYTYDTLSILTKIMPGTNIVFLMGMDSLCSIHTWYRASELVQHFNFLVYPRPGITPPPYAVLKEHFGTANAQKLLNSIIDSEELTTWDISSSDLRAARRRGGDLTNYLPEKVWAYIQEQGLYND